MIKAAIIAWFLTIIGYLVMAVIVKAANNNPSPKLATFLLYSWLPIFVTAVVLTIIAIIMF